MKQKTQTLVEGFVVSGVVHFEEVESKDNVEKRQW